MSGNEIAAPVVQLVGDEGAGYCDPESGVCAVPTASETQERGERSRTADAQ